MKTITCYMSFLLLFPVAVYATANNPLPDNYAEVGIGCSNAKYIDRDCDGYGVGRDFVLGPDADDTDANVNTTASITGSGGYGSVENFIKSRLGYTCTRFAVIDKTNGQDGAGTVSTSLAISVADPFKDIDDVVWQAGDCILLRGAPTQLQEYTRAYYASGGEEGNPVVYMSYPGELATVIKSKGGQNDWMTYDNLRFYKIGIGRNDRSGFTLRNCELDGNGEGGSPLYHFMNLMDWTLEYNLTHGIVASHAWYLGNRGYNDNSIDCNGSTPIPSDNLVIRGNVFNTPACTDHISYNGHIEDIDGSGYGLLIEQNIFSDRGGRGGLNLLQGINDAIIRNNVFVNGGGGGIRMGWYWQAYDDGYGPWDGHDNVMICRYNMNNIKIYNNTFNMHDLETDGMHCHFQGGIMLYDSNYGIGPNPNSPDPWPAGASTWVEKNFAGLKIFNNIFYGYGHNLCDQHAGVPIRLNNAFLFQCNTNTPQVYNNLIFREADADNGYSSKGILLESQIKRLNPDGYFEGTCQSQWYDNTFGDPNFVSVNESYYNQGTSVDLRITDPQSPAVGGCGAGTPSYDIKGNIRSGSDCGAYELPVGGPITLPDPDPDPDPDPEPHTEPDTDPDPGPGHNPDPSDNSDKQSSSGCFLGLVK